MRPTSAGEPFGQIRTEVPPRDDGRGETLVSSNREVEQGARSMLLLLDGLFRLDVIPHDDSVQTILRNLSDEAHAELRFAPVGGGATVLAGSEEVTAPATGRFGGEVVLIGEGGEERTVARVLVGSICHLERGVTAFTAQAVLPARDDS